MLAAPSASAPPSPRLPPLLPSPARAHPAWGRAPWLLAARGGRGRRPLTSDLLLAATARAGAAPTSSSTWSSTRWPKVSLTCGRRLGLQPAALPRQPCRAGGLGQARGRPVSRMCGREARCGLQVTSRGGCCSRGAPRGGAALVAATPRLPKRPGRQRPPVAPVGPRAVAKRHSDGDILVPVRPGTGRSQLAHACGLQTPRSGTPVPHPCPAPGAAADRRHTSVCTRVHADAGSRGPHSVFSWFGRGGGPARRCARAGAKHSPALPREACGACRRPAGRGFLGRTGVSETGPAPRSTPHAPGAGSERADGPDRRTLHFQEKVRFPISTWLQPFRLEGCVPVRWSRRPLRCPGRSANVQLPGMRFVSCPFQPPPPSARQAEPDPRRPQVAPPAGGGA